MHHASNCGNFFYFIFAVPPCHFVGYKQVAPTTDCEHGRVSSFEAFFFSFMVASQQTRPSTLSRSLAHQSLVSLIPPKDNICCPTAETHCWTQCSCLVCSVPHSQECYFFPIEYINHIKYPSSLSLIKWSHFHRSTTRWPCDKLATCPGWTPPWPWDRWDRLQNPATRVQSKRWMDEV